MALVTHQMQGSCATFTSKPISWNNGIELKRFVTTLHMVVKTDRVFSLRCKSCLSVGAPFICGLEAKALRISAFQGSAQNDEQGCRAIGSKLAKHSVKFSHVCGSEETLTESSKLEEDIALSYTSEADETIAGSLAIQYLFKNWLTQLRMLPPNVVVNGTLEGPDQGKISVMQNGTPNKERGEILKAIWCYFWGLDTTVKILLLIFIPWYMAVNVAYGAEVSKELTPLWICGPLIVALYIKMLQGLSALYVFSFKQTFKLVKNLPTCYAAVYNYIARGKLGEEICARLWQPILDIKSLDYQEFSKRKMKDLTEWAAENYLNFVESIWPCYCRTIRFLKRANII